VNKNGKNYLHGQFKLRLINKLTEAGYPLFRPHEMRISELKALCKLCGISKNEEEDDVL
jgi:hypothetical protein